MRALDNGLISPAAFRFISKDGICKTISLFHCKYPMLVTRFLILNFPFINGLLPTIKITWKSLLNGFHLSSFVWLIFTWHATQDFRGSVRERWISTHRR
jgi:hypothetical protein